MPFKNIHLKSQIITYLESNFCFIWHTHLVLIKSCELYNPNTDSWSLVDSQPQEYQYKSTMIELDKGVRICFFLFLFFSI